MVVQNAIRSFKEKTKIILLFLIKHRRHTFVGFFFNFDLKYVQFIIFHDVIYSIESACV